MFCKGKQTAACHEKDENKITMKTKHNIPEWAKDTAVTDCRTLEEFAHKYRKPERFTMQGEEYVKAIMKSHYDDIGRRGYTSISQFDNTTGKHITFIPKTN